MRILWSLFLLIWEPSSLPTDGFIFELKLAKRNKLLLSFADHLFSDVFRITEYKT